MIYDVTPNSHSIYFFFSQMARGLIPRRHLLTPKALEVVKKADRKFKFIPIVFILLRVWGTIRFFRFLAHHPDDPPLLKWLVVLHVRSL